MKNSVPVVIFTPSFSLYTPSLVRVRGFSFDLFNPMESAEITSYFVLSCLGISFVVF